MTERKRKEAAETVTALDVARAAGVSQSTVSRVFSPQSGITPRKKEYILEVARKMGYHPNALARGLTMNRSYIVAMVGIGQNDPFYSHLLAGMLNSLQQNGLQMLIFNYYEGGQLEGIVEKFYQYNVDGIILTSSALKEEDVCKIVKTGKPVVLMNRILPDTGAKAICCDNTDGVRKILEHFLETGRRNIGLLGGPESSYTASDRTNAFLRELEAKGMEPKCFVRAEALTHASGESAMKRLLAGQGPLDAVFCTNDLLALGAVDAARGLGFSVPEQIAIAGFDGDMSADWSPYRLTTVQQPVEKLIEASISTLNRMITGEADVPACQTFQGSLIVRNSTVKE